MTARDLAATVRAKRRRELAEKLSGVVSWPTREELDADEWFFGGEESEFVALCTPREIAALEKQAEDAQARELRLAQGLRVIRDTTGEYAANVASRALIEAGVPDPPDEDHL